jgi:cytochrome b561
MVDLAAPNISQASNGIVNGKRYDSVTLWLHWLTAALVIALFALAEVWGFLPRGSVRRTMVGVHVSLGIILVLAVILRILWRGSFSRRLPLAGRGLLGVVAQVGHYLLYLLLLIMICTGPLNRWASGRPLNFFWLFKIPSPLSADKALHSLVISVHFWAAWTIIILAALHAVAALFHHYVLRDGVLMRMMPGRR